MRRTLVVFGERTATEALEAAQAGGAGQFTRLMRLYFEPQQFSATDAPSIEQNVDEVFYLIGITDETLKQQIILACEHRHWRPCNVIHPTAVVSPSATLGVGIFVGPLAVVSSNASVGDHSILHIHCSIGHDAQIGQMAAILPGARISGHVKIGDRVLIGSNAFIAASKQIGNDCRVDALSHVKQDLPDAFIASPRLAKPIPRVFNRPLPPAS